MTLAWHPELLEQRHRFCSEFERRCLRCGQPIIRRGPSFELILGVIEMVFGVQQLELASARRQTELVEARAFAVWALRSLGRARSYTVIGRLLDRDQSSVNHLHRKAIELRLRSDYFDATCRGLGQRWLNSGETAHARCS